MDLRDLERQLRPVGSVGRDLDHGPRHGTLDRPGLLELSLPRGWRAQRTAEAATITGWAGPNPSAGVHYGMIGVVHAGATRIRFTAIPRDASSLVWFAVDGVTTPTTFTGDADPGHQTEIHAVGWVLLD